MFIDSHSHFDVEAFDADRADALARARAVGVEAQIVPAIERASWQRLADVCAAHPGLYPAYGLHPCYLDRHADEDTEALRGWLAGHDTVAVGECGLDLYDDTLDVERQTRIFIDQLKIARDLDLPVVVHARRAVDQVMKCIRQVGDLRGVVHSFAGSRDQADRLRKLGFVIGVGGPLTYARANRLRTVVATLPAGGFLLETDAPDQPDCDHRGMRNEPANLPRVAVEAAALRGEPLASLAAHTTAAAIALFNLPQSRPLADASGPVNRA